MRDRVLHRILSGQQAPLTYVHPIIGLQQGRVEAKEVLTRFVDEDGQLTTVGSLLEDLSLDAELKVQLDLLCLAGVFESLARNPITDHLIFINLSPLTLDYPDFWQRIEPWLWNLTIPPHRLVLEITETYSLHDLDHLERYVARLRGMDLRLAVDDVGSGIASLSHLARLQPDFIKVDKSLVHDVHHRPYQAALLHALAVFAERMNVGYIAEGIETLEELQVVADVGVPWGQGFIFGEPQPLTLSPDQD